MSDSSQLGEALAGSTTILLQCDFDGRVRAANEACGNFFGIRGPKLEGHPLALLANGDDEAAFEAELATLDAPNAVLQLEHSALRADGEMRTLLWRIERQAEGGLAVVGLDVTDLRDSQAKISKLVYDDPLTGLPNRRLFEDRLAQARALLRRTGERFALHLLDLDRFKEVNDTFGHAAGDELLKSVTERLLALLRKTDTLARLGGDEFAILQPTVDSETGAEILARKVCESLSQPFDILGHEVHIGCSVGIAIAEDADDAEQIKDQADRALYAVKDSGRGFFAFDTSELGAAALSELELAHALEEALAGDELFLVWQPEYHLAHNRLTAVEALVRWRRQDGTVVQPDRIIAVAERHGLIRQLGEWVIRRALKQAGDWLRTGVDLPRLCVNLSAQQLRDPGLAECIRAALEEFSVPAHLVELELTESGFVADEQVMMRGLERLSDLGISVSVDDFGTGYSSFQYLRRFAFARLKVAQEFAERSHEGDMEDRAILRAAVDLASGLGMEAVVEGVESSETVTELRSMGVQSIQGHVLAPPEETEEFEKTLRDPSRLISRMES